MLVRFVIDDLDPNSGRRQGLFQAARTLRESTRLSQTDHDALLTIRDWFNEHLERPERLAPSSRSNAKNTALSWFRDSAHDHIAKMRAFADILERHGMAVRMIRTDRPGYTLYEDEFQVAAYPFADTPT